LILAANLRNYSELNKKRNERNQISTEGHAEKGIIPVSSK
jgi:hypothetical protein